LHFATSYQNLRGIKAEIDFEMICPQCESENAFAAPRCVQCGNPFGPARKHRTEDRSLGLSNLPRPSSKATFLDWLGWFAALAASGILVFLWLVFGLAAAGNSVAGLNEIHSFIAVTAMGGAPPAIASFVLLLMKRGGIGIAVALCILPSVFGAFVIQDLYLKSLPP
jgi:hypothetical protein